MTYNVIDTRQTYLQKLLKQALATLGHVKEAERSHHFSYEMVALSHRTARELGYQDFDESRPFVEVSGRKGLGVKADDLFDRLIAKAHAEVVKRNADCPEDVSRKTAEQIAIAAVRYFLIKFTRTKVIAFDIDEALAFEGETGPYLQYSVVRARNIFNKLQEREGLGEAEVIAKLADTPSTPLEGEEGDDLWNLVLEAGRLDEVVEQAVRSLEPAGLAKYAFALAQLFNALYHKYPVLNEERPEWRIWRAAAISYYKRQLTKALELMGASVPARMDSNDVRLRMPLIAIAPASRNDDYIESARQAGAETWLLDREGMRRRTSVRNAAGIMLLGGADVEPARYGEAPHPTFEASEGSRDEYETELIALAIERDLPLLAICRGIQILNVALGGSLIQDIPSQTSSLTRHAISPNEPKCDRSRTRSPWRAARACTRFSARSSTRGACAAVNSRHHQAVKRLGRDLVVTAVAPDGIIEAIERPASSFCVGVQWHPENFCREEGYNFAPLFRAFVSAAERRLAGFLTPPHRLSRSDRLELADRRVGARRGDLAGRFFDVQLLHHAIFDDRGEALAARAEPEAREIEIEAELLRCIPRCHPPASAPCRSRRSPSPTRRARTRR